MAHLICFVLLSSLGTQAFAKSSQADSAQPNIVLMVADDLGYQDVECYGASLIKTPNIDGLAKQGVRFTDAHSISAICMPSRYGILSGTYYFHGKRRPLYGFQFHDGQVTLPSLMKSGGYKTAALGKWHNGLGTERVVNYNAALKPGPLEIGFDSFFGTPRSHNEPPLVFVEGHHVVGLEADDPISVDMSPQFGVHGRMRGGKKARAARPDEKIDMILADKAAKFFEQQKPDQPFFLYLAFQAPHTPLNPAPEFRGKSKAAIYGDYIQQLDYCTGVVLNALEKEGLSENTIVIFTSDNGGRFEEEALRAGHRPNGNLIGQKTDAWEGGHRVPCIARWPKHIPPGSERNELFVLIDLMATLAEAAGIDMPKGASPDGASELDAFKNPTSPAKRTEAVLHGTGPSSYILRQDDWVYIPKQGSGGKTVPEPKRPWSLPYGELGFKNSDVDDKGQIKQGAPKVQLYNLRNDPNQSSNVAAAHAEKVKAMDGRLNALLGRTK
ncbi:MAG: arylsulfatase [Mariniblastus sp.]